MKARNRIHAANGEIAHPLQMLNKSRQPILRLIECSRSGYLRQYIYSMDRGTVQRVFKESFKNTAANSASFLRTATNELEFLKFKVQQGSHWDEAGVLFYPSAAEGLDNYDALNLTGSAVDVATVMADGKNAAIEVLPQIGEQRILPLKVQTPANGPASFRFEGMENIPSNTSIFLKDDFFGSLTDIRQHPEISFEAEAGQVYNRFSLILAEQVLTGAESNLVQKKLSLHPNPASNRVAVYSPAEGELELINALGMFEKTCSQLRHELFDKIDALTAELVKRVRESGAGAVVKDQ